MPPLPASRQPRAGPGHPQGREAGRDPTIREKFNTCRFADDKEKVVDLPARVTRVSMETVAVAEAMSTTDAPSVRGVELPAVIVASGPLPNTGASRASLSTLVSGRRF
jgi:hypothetical protein